MPASKLCFFLLLLCSFIHKPLQAQIRYAVDTTYHSDSSCKQVPLAYFQVKGKYPEKPGSLVKRANKALENIPFSPVNGYITYRMLISCKGVPVAYQLLQNDMNYKPAAFPKELVDALYYFVAGLKDWKPAIYNNEPVYYSAYLSFKISNGHVVEVAP